MDEQLINEYINNLANQVNNLTQENILLKTRLSLLEKREQERLTAEEKVKESFTKEVPTQPAPKSEYSTPPEEQPKPQVEQIVPKEPDFVNPSSCNLFIFFGFTLFIKSVRSLKDLLLFLSSTIFEIASKPTLLIAPKA